MVPNRHEMQQRLAEAGIVTAVHYPLPLNEQPAYKHLCCPDCTPIAQQLAKRVMSLPFSADLDELTQKTVVKYL
jgi:UDP-2-acetamido-2-deoxy-ribo-hexuluronate aminotransferase